MSFDSAKYWEDAYERSLVYREEYARRIDELTREVAILNEENEKLLSQTHHSLQEQLDILKCKMSQIRDIVR